MQGHKKTKQHNITLVNLRQNLLNIELSYYSQSEKVQKVKDFKLVDLVMREFVWLGSLLSVNLLSYHLLLILNHYLLHTSLLLLLVFLGLFITMMPRYSCLICLVLLRVLRMARGEVGKSLPLLRILIWFWWCWMPQRPNNIA